MKPTGVSISVIIPTVNEANRIYSLIQFIIKNGGNALLEVIVVDGASKDETINEAQRAGALVLTSAIRTRAAQMNLGARKARGSVLYFVHADIKLPPNFVDDIVESLHLNFQAGCYRFLFDSNKRILKINAYFTRFRGIMCRGGDQTLFVTKSVFEELAGFDEYYSIMEDYDFIMRLRKKHTFRIIPKEVIVSARKYEGNSWFRVQVANLTVFLMFFLKQHPKRMKRVYNMLIRRNELSH
jgi:rSAM/selenodomain-associated transferase 2